MGRVSKAAKKTGGKALAATARGTGRLAQKGVKSGYQAGRKRSEQKPDK